MGVWRELHWALVPVFIPVGSAVIRWTLGLTLVALVYYSALGFPLALSGYLLVRRIIHCDGDYIPGPILSLLVWAGVSGSGG